MARKDPRPEVSRRKFLAGVAVTGAAVTTTSGASAATPPVGAARKPAALRPTAHQIAAETGIPKDMPHLTGRPNSDFMVDVIKSMKIEHIYSNPASSFRGLHESLINYGKNSQPDFITCMHEESSVAMCHGNYKASGKPQMMLCHGTVGLMHGTMAVYNAWADRVPLIMVGGNDLDASRRPPGVPTFHSAQDIGALVRDFTKWDDTPMSAQHFAQSFVRAYKYAMTPPYGPVLISLDAGLQDSPVDDQHLYIPRYVPTSPPNADLNALRETAKLLVAAENPVIVVDKMARTAEGMNHMIALAELLQVPVVDQGGRMNMPNTHYLNQNAAAQNLIRNADLIMGLECSDFWNTVNQWIDNGEEHGHGLRETRIKPGTKLITISSVELNTKANFQDFQRFQVTDIGMAGDAEASLPALIEAVKSAIPNDKKAAYEKRGEALKKAWQQGRERGRQTAALGWDASPISTARLNAEVYNAVKDEDWSLVTSTGNTSGWSERLFKFDRHYRWLGRSGASGLGYGLPASVGAAHANQALGRFSVSIQGDGDMMYAPGALWTAAHHEIPLLTVMHNNRGYHQEVMHVQRLSNRRNRVASLGKSSGPIGTSIDTPNIDYAALARSMGWWAKGPISDPKDLGPALKEAVAVVKKGQPALIDSVTQPR
ncbi:MAG: acetolactate synthase large subunit [Alphaproteobacteria bacterium]|nr:acetolactate synthase large subunit [Alphaproteobacteria bacterium]